MSLSLIDRFSSSIYIRLLWQIRTLFSRVLYKVQLMLANSVLNLATLHKRISDLITV